MAQVSCVNLTLGYDNITLAENINFSVKSGEYLCVVGENGSGKSTLIKTILGLTKPKLGKIEWGDGVKPNQVGYLNQQREMVKEFPASVKEVVMSGFIRECGLMPFYSKMQKLKAIEIMQMLDIYNCRKKCFNELSGGQQQRVLLSRALCATDKLLVLDEPVTGLDPKVTSELYSCIEKLNKQGVTIIMISHDINTALSYATHILQLGVGAYYGTTQNYLEYKRLKPCKICQGGAVV